MIKKIYSNVDVVTMARQRIKNIFSNDCKVELSISGGKDSICLNDLVFKMCQSGEIDKSKLIVDFMDEEAIYPCVERIVKNIRRQWLSIGVEFRWWALEYKHYNCFNMLTSDESFVCFDHTKKDVWVRQPPSYAIRYHPFLDAGVDNYQSFMSKVSRGMIQMIGVRASESLQRFRMLAGKKTFSNAYPIYDWQDHDVWMYIRDNGLDFPDAYMHMYQVGTNANNMRISQFFSIDTARQLVKMCEFYPSLFDRICKREPNAYMAMLYFDTELYRSAKKKNKDDEEIDYKEKTIELLKKPELFIGDTQQANYKRFHRFVSLNAPLIRNKNWKRIYGALIGGDPKSRTYRAVMIDVFGNTVKD